MRDALLTRSPMVSAVLGRLVRPDRADPLDAMPIEALSERAAGYGHSDEFASRRSLYERLAESGTQPRVAVIQCSDCACDVSVPLAAEPGSLFSIRNAGNVVPPFGVEQGETAAAIELALSRMPIEQIVVCGHSGCLTLDGYLEGDREIARPWLSHLKPTADALERLPHDDDVDRHAWAGQHNVLVQLHHLSTHPIVAGRLAEGSLSLHGWYLDTARGELFAARSLAFTSDICGAFEPL